MHNKYECLSRACYAGLRHTILEERPVHQMLVFVCLCFPPTTNRPVATATNPLESEVTFKKNAVLIWRFTHSQSVTLTGLLIFINTHLHNIQTQFQWNAVDFLHTIE